jgi:hypothetical protein
MARTLLFLAVSKVNRFVTRGSNNQDVSALACALHLL